MTSFFYVLWGQEDGKFKSPEALKGTDGKNLVIIIPKGSKHDGPAAACTRPTAVDFTGDGKLDLVVGNLVGHFYLFKGQGEGQFSPESQRIEVDGKPLLTGPHSDPFFADMDGDGDLDLLTGSNYGGISMIANSAGKGQPIVLAAKAKAIFPELSRNPDTWIDDERRPATATRVAVADVNEDGKPDIIFGDMADIISPKEGIDPENAKTQWLAYEKERDLLEEGFNTAETDDEFKSLYARSGTNHALKAKFTKEEFTGHIWVMYQK